MKLKIKLYDIKLVAGIDSQKPIFELSTGEVYNPDELEKRLKIYLDIDEGILNNTERCDILEKCRKRGYIIEGNLVETGIYLQKDLKFGELFNDNQEAYQE